MAGLYIMGKISFVHSYNITYKNRDTYDLKFLFSLNPWWDSDYKKWSSDEALNYQTKLAATIGGRPICPLPGEMGEQKVLKNWVLLQ